MKSHGDLPNSEKDGLNGEILTNHSKQVFMHVVLNHITANKKFAIVTAHAKSGDDNADIATKIRQAEYMADKLKKFSIPVIYAADFNTNPGTKAFKKFVEKANGFKSAYPVKTEDNVKGGKQNETPTTSYKFRRGGDQPEKCRPISQAIDFIFHSEQWKCTKLLTIPKELQELVKAKCAGLPNWRYPSDHVMIGAELELTV